MSDRNCDFYSLNNQEIDLVTDLGSLNLCTYDNETLWSDIESHILYILSLMKVLGKMCPKLKRTPFHVLFSLKLTVF